MEVREFGIYGGWCFTDARESKNERRKTLTMQDASGRNAKVMDEIIDNAAGFPVESQYMILMMAKAMKYTRDCVMRQLSSEQSHKLHKSEHAN